MTDVNVTEDDERVDRAFHCITQNFTVKAEKNATKSSSTTKQQVKLSLAAVFIKL